MATLEPLAAMVIPAHNGERHLDAAIASVRNQTLAEIEIIVVDDGSTDRTAAIVDEHARADPRVRRIEATVGSAGAARNIGWRAAQAPFVGNLDQDDLAEPERLERQRAFLLEHPEVGLVGSFCHLIDDAGVQRGNIATLTDPAEVMQRVVDGKPGIVTHATATFRRSVLVEVGGYREIPGTAVEDLDIYWRVAERRQVANLGEYLGSWRIHGGNSSRGVDNMLRWTYVVENAALQRRRGLPDPLDGRKLESAPSDEELAQIGVDRATLARAVFRFHLAWIGLLLTVKETHAARRELDLAEPYLAGLGRAQRGLFLVSRAQIEYAERRRLKAVATTAAAAAAAPRALAKNLAHPVVGGLGRKVYRRLPARVERPARWLRDWIVGRLNRLGPPD